MPGSKGSVQLGLSIDEPIERVVSLMAARGVRITGTIARTEQGHFVEIEDPSGNTIYLWEPAGEATDTAPRDTVASAN